ncbi:MAG TPA: hypothetical protein VJA84_00805 [Candidatus Omnitrophota bacterium]|nr:hypothetical protein [Candidatus Omnitrophota bacterium]
MNLPVFAANVDFSQSSFRIFGCGYRKPHHGPLASGNPDAPTYSRSNIGTTRMFELFLPEQKQLVPQPPKIRKNFGGYPPKAGGKIDLSEKTDRFFILG